jgi:hypothetical protein
MKCVCVCVCVYIYILIYTIYNMNDCLSKWPDAKLFLTYTSVFPIIYNISLQYNILIIYYRCCYYYYFIIGDGGSISSSGSGGSSSIQIVILWHRVVLYGIPTAYRMSQPVRPHSVVLFGIFTTHTMPQPKRQSEPSPPWKFPNVLLLLLLLLFQKHIRLISGPDICKYRNTVLKKQWNWHLSTQFAAYCRCLPLRTVAGITIGRVYFF